MSPSERPTKGTQSDAATPEQGDGGLFGASASGSSRGSLSSSDGGTGSSGSSESSGEPRLWLCQLVVVDELGLHGKAIRDVRFRRGLNVIATEEATDSDAAPVGHSVGKTLLVRLIRYCLGDPSFCTRATRSAITDAWEHGYVLAHFRVDSEDWVVARPIGLDSGASSSFCGKSADLASVRSDQAERERYAVFRDRLESLVAADFADFELPHIERQDRRALWTDYMGWLVRDQHCRYRHAAEWRDPDIDAGVASLHKEDASLVIQMALGLFDAPRKKLATAHQSLLASRAAEERERVSLEGFLGRAGALLSPDPQGAGLDASVPLLADSIKSRAEDEIKGLKGLQAELDDPSDVRAAEVTAKRCVEVRVQSEGEAAAVAATLEATETQLKQLENASTEQAYQMFALLGTQYCPLFATKQEADRQGCPGQGTPLTVGARDPQHARKIGDTDQTVKRLRVEVAAANDRVVARQAEEADAITAATSARGAFHVRLRGVAESIGRAEERLRQATALRSTWDSMDRIGNRIAALDRKIDESLERQQTLRTTLEQRQRSLSSRFDGILKRLLGPAANGAVVIDGRGIRPEVGKGIAIDGEAMSTSATVLSFDLASLLHHEAGGGCALGFLCHDSPREADMEASIYDRLFRLARDNERSDSDTAASFQYIVTTTSPPPKDIGEPYVILMLGARSPDQLLLRRRF